MILRNILPGYCRNPYPEACTTNRSTLYQVTYPAKQEAASQSTQTVEQLWLMKLRLVLTFLCCRHARLVASNKKRCGPDDKRSGSELIRTLWGVERFDHVEEWPALFTELAASNYSGVEAPTWVVCGVGPSFDIAHECEESRAASFRKALASSGLYYVAQVHTAGYPIASGEASVHVESLRGLVYLAIESLGATLANVHGGCDWWPIETTLEFFGAALELEDELRKSSAKEGTARPFISHETHRMRSLATPASTQSVLAAYPGLPLTADLSHWVVGAERTFDFPSDATWWPSLLALVANATVLTHARVGAPREIQVADPRAPEHRQLLEAYEAWWDVIWAAQRKRGAPLLIEAEYGPAPYMPVLPYTNQPVAHLESVVESIGRRQVTRVANGACELV